MGKGGGKGRGDDSSSDSDEDDGKLKILYLIICCLACCVFIFGVCIFALVIAGQASGVTTELGLIRPPVGEYQTPQEISVTHDDYITGADDVFIYCTIGLGLQHAEVPCESSNILYEDNDRFTMMKNGAYSCIFCQKNELCSGILEHNYIIHAQPPVIAPPEEFHPDKFQVSFTTPYEWERNAATETMVFYTNSTTEFDCIEDDDFDTCPGAPAVPCWPPVVKAARSRDIYLYDPEFPPFMDSSVYVAATAKVKAMGLSPCVTQRYQISTVAEVRIEPCEQDAVDYITRSADILMWTSTPGARIQYTIDHRSTCINVDTLTGNGHRSGDASAVCRRERMDLDGNPTYDEAENLHPASACTTDSGSSCLFDYNQPFSLDKTSRVVAVGQHSNTAISDSIISICDYELVVAVPAPTQTVGSNWMFDSADSNRCVGSPVAPRTNTDFAVIRFLSPTPDSTVLFRYCRDSGQSQCSVYYTYNPDSPPLVFESIDVEAFASKPMLTSSAVIRTRYQIKYAPPQTPTPTEGTHGPTFFPFESPISWEPDVTTIGSGTSSGSSSGSCSGSGSSSSGSSSGTGTGTSSGSGTGTGTGTSSRCSSVSEVCPYCEVYPDECGPDDGLCTSDGSNPTETGFACPTPVPEDPCADPARGCLPPIDLCIYYRYSEPCCNLDPSEVTITVPNDCAWIRFTDPFVLARSQTICTRSNSCGGDSTPSDPVTSSYYVRATPPVYNVDSYTVAVNEINVCVTTETPGAEVYYRMDPNMLSIGFSEATSTAQLAQFDYTYPYGTTTNNGLQSSVASASSPLCFDLFNSEMISGVTVKGTTIDQDVLEALAEGVEFDWSTMLGGLTGTAPSVPVDQPTAEAGTPTRSFYFIEVDKPVIGPDQSAVDDSDALVLPDVDSNGVGDIYTQTAVEITTVAGSDTTTYDTTTIKYAIEEYHCTDVSACSASDRAAVDTIAASFDSSHCNGYDPVHSCGTCDPLLSIYDSAAFTLEDACLSYLNVQYPKVAQYVITCHEGEFDEVAISKLAPLSGCSWNTYDADDQPIVDRSSFVYSYGQRDGCEKSLVASRYFEILVDGITIDTTSGETVATCPSVLATPSGYYVGPTNVAFSTPTPDGRVIGSEEALVTIHYFWSNQQFDAGSPVEQCGGGEVADGAPAPRCTPPHQGGTPYTDRYEYNFNGAATDGRPVLATDNYLAGVNWIDADDFTAVEIGTIYAYGSKPGLTDSAVSSCEMELQAKAPDWFQSGEICSEVSNSDNPEPVCKSPALFGSGFVFLWSESETVIKFELEENTIASASSRSSDTFEKWIQLVATDITFFYSLKTFAVKAGMWDSDEVNQPFVVVTEISRGAIPSTDLPAGLDSDVCQGCEVENILFGRPGQFWGAEWDVAIVDGQVSITMDFPGRWDEAFIECSDSDSVTLTAETLDANYLVTTVYFAYPFIPDPERNYQRAASACQNYEVSVQQSVRTNDVGRTWYIGGEEFGPDGVPTKCQPSDVDRTGGCWRETIAEPVADEPDRRYRDTDSYTPEQPIRATALKYTCKQLPFYIESWVVYGIPGASLDTADINTGGTGAVCQNTASTTDASTGVVTPGLPQMADCNNICRPAALLGDGTCDCAGCNDGRDCMGSDASADCVADFNCVDFLYDRMDCFELESDTTGGASIQDLFQDGFGR